MSYQRHQFTAALIAAFAVTLSLGFAANPAQAQDDVQAPPPLTEEDLARAVNADAPRNSPRAQSPTEGVIREFGDDRGVYLLEVSPSVGRSYYVIDGDGDGTPGQYRQNIEADDNVGKWKLGEW